MAYNNHTDLQMISLFQKNLDIAVLSALYLRYTHHIYGVCLKYLKNQQDAKDVSMEIYELLIKRLPGKEIDDFSKWLYVVCKNHCFEKLRRESKKLPKETAAATMYSENIFHPDDVKREEELMKMEGCLEKLKDLQRRCVTMFYLDKKNYEEIATVLSLEWNKVRSHIQNGRRNLKICMNTK